MVLRLSGLLAAVVLFLMLFASPILCARGGLGFLHSQQHAHYHPHQIYSSKTDTDASSIINTQVVTGTQNIISSEPPTLTRAPGDMATSHVVAPRDGSIASIGVPKQEADSMQTMTTYSSLTKFVSAQKTSGHTSDLHRESNQIMDWRTLLDTPSRSNPALAGEENVNFILASFTRQKDNSLFNMLPRGQSVPPSGPSKDHNSILTDKSN